MSKKRQSLAEYKRQNPEQEVQNKSKRSDKELAQQQSNVYGILFVVGILLVAGIAVYFYLYNTNPDNQPLPPITLPANLDLNSIPDNSQSFPSMGNQHIASNVARDYNSNPPTSGNHNPQWVTPLGVYRDGRPDDMLIHNLEHGHIWLSYRDANDREAIALLTALQQKYSDRVIVSYRPNDPTRVAAAAWTRLLTLDELDSEQLEAFIIRYNNQAPESILGR